MTTPEDRLRQILLAEAEDLIPAGDGLRRIEQRLADRRTLRSRLVPAVAIAGIVVVAGAAAVTVSLTDDGSLLPPSHHPTAAPTTCTGGLCEEPKPSPSLPTTGVTTAAHGTPVWPFTTDAQVADWKASPGSRAWASDPVQVTQHLLDDYVKLPGRAQRQQPTYDEATVIDVVAGGRIVSQVSLVQVGRDPDGPWSVTGAISEHLRIEGPADGAEVVSPIPVTGMATDPDTSVHLRFLTDRLLGEGHAMAGSELPWTHSLSLTSSSWSVGALVANTFNGKGDLHAITITPLLRAGATGLPVAGSMFLAVDDKHRVVTVDTLSGKQLRQLSYPPNGAIDSAPDRGGEDGVVWVRTQPDGCTSSIIRVGLVRGPAGVTVDAKPLRRSLPSLSDGGRSVAWVEQPCDGGPSTLVVRGPDANFSTTATSTAPIEQLDVRDDGWAVVQAGGRLAFVPPGTAELSKVPALTPPHDCVLAAPAWDGDTVLAWRGCPGNEWSLGRWSVRSGSEKFGPVMSGLPEPLHTAVTGSQVLVWLTGGRVVRVSGNHFSDVPNATRWSDPDW